MLALLLVLAACAGDDDDDRADTINPPTSTLAPATATPEPPTPTLEPTVTEPEPTNTEQAESSDEPTPEPTDEPASTATPTIEPTAAPAPTATPEPTADTGDGDDRPEDDLAQSLLLQIEDMPVGWTTSDLHIDDDEEEDDDDLFICDTPPIDEQLQATGGAETSFEQSQLGPWVEQLVAVLESQDDAEEAMEWFRDAFTCAEWHTENDDGQPVVWRLSPLSFPVVGDETFATRASVDSGGFTFDVDLIIFRESRVISMILNLGLSIDPDDTIAVSEAAAQRIRDGL